MSTAEKALFELEGKIEHMENEVQRRKDIANYLHYLGDTGQLAIEDVICAMSWLDHTTKTADEIIDILEKGE